MCVTDTIYYYIVSMTREYSDTVKTSGIMFSRKKKIFQILISYSLWEAHKLGRELLHFNINKCKIHDEELVITLELLYPRHHITTSLGRILTIPYHIRLSISQQIIYK